MLTTTTGITGSYSFDNLPNGNFIVLVDTADADLPPGYGATTPTVVPVTGLGTTKVARIWYEALTNLLTSEIVWTEEKEIRKAYKKRSIGL